MTRFHAFVRLGLAAALLCPVSAVAQTSRKPRAADRVVDSVPDDIVVEGYRERPDIDTSVSTPALISVARNRTIYEFSERMARCAARSRLSDLSRLRAVVDGEFNTATLFLAQDRLKRTYVTCGEAVSLLGFTMGNQSDQEQGSVLNAEQTELVNFFASDAAPLGHSIYDRGAFTVQALKKFAPDLRLTREQTGDHAVQFLFNLHEVPRNHHRLPEDYRYFETAVCMVRVDPD